MIVCDGDEKRINRGIVFSENIRYIGVASSSLPGVDEETCVVMNFCELYYNINDPIPIKVLNKYQNHTDKHMNINTLKVKKTINFIK